MHPHLRCIDHSIASLSCQRCRFLDDPPAVDEAEFGIYVSCVSFLKRSPTYISYVLLGPRTPTVQNFSVGGGILLFDPVVRWECHLLAAIGLVKTRRF